MKKSTKSAVTPQKTCTICNKSVQRIGGGKYRHCKATTDGHLVSFSTLLIPNNLREPKKLARGKSPTSPQPSITEDPRGVSIVGILDAQLGKWEAGDGSEKTEKAVDAYQILTARNTLIDHLLSRVAALEEEVHSIEETISVLETIQEPRS